MANQAALALETARLQEESLRQERLAEQLRVARQIQLSLLPDDAPEVPGWDFAATYRPAQVVGGDFYDYFYLPGSPLRWAWSSRTWRTRASRPRCSWR